jgi:tetratricopeptide (TPR) repeat protein
VKSPRGRVLVVLLLACPVLVGCMRFKPEWNPVDAATRPPSGAADAELALAREASQRAVDAEGLRLAMAAYEKVLAADPRNYAALVALADHSILMAAAYTDARDAKRELYDRAMRLGERAMYTNSDFRELADGGSPPWEACRVLTEREMESMMVWMTALLYNFKECMSVPARVANVRWMTYLDPMLDRMEQLDEGWEGGAIPFTRGFYYFVVPRSLGGDRDKATRSFARAVELGPDRLVNRWGRARYFAVVTDNREGFVEDLEWVATRDPEAFADSPAWKAYVQRDAKLLLEQTDRLF